MPIPLQNRAEYAALFQHELGHWVIARALGFAPGHIALREAQAEASIHLIPSISSLDDAAKYIENRVCILFAGAIAECTNSKGKIDQKRCRSLFNSSAANDHAKIRELLRVLAGIRKPGSKIGDDLQPELTKCDTELAERAANMVIGNALLISDMKLHAMKHLDAAYDAGTFNKEFVLPLEVLEAFPDLDKRLVR